MARNTIKVPITDDGRDKGKVFFLTEMTASLGEAWATRVLLALMASNAEVPAGFLDLGMAGLAQMGARMVLSGIQYDKLAPMLQEMMDTIQAIPEPKAVPFYSRPLIEEDIEEISTRLKLKMEVWNLNMGFLKGVLPFLK